MAANSAITASAANPGLVQRLPRSPATEVGPGGSKESSQDGWSCDGFPLRENENTPTSPTTMISNPGPASAKLEWKNHRKGAPTATHWALAATAQGFRPGMELRVLHQALPKTRSEEHTSEL